jgi:murein DD-endopeptidase MepM/ murein hydrolase activator NlpD
MSGWMGLVGRWAGLGAAAIALASVAELHAQTLRFPTANRALLEPGGLDRFLVGTVGKPAASGGFGCVRSEGMQFHEGLDIRSLQRDRRGEPVDPVCATADGTVAYVSSIPALSNYGIYVVLRHAIDGIELYSLYAHLREARADLRLGQAVKAGEPIGVMGRTANTRQGIGKDRAHVHFELDCLVNDGFAAYYRKHFPDQRNDHGVWNGRNLVGLDPGEALAAAARPGARFSLLGYLQGQTELCRVFVRVRSLPWARSYAPLVTRNPAAERDGVAGYELTLNYNGVPFRVVPRSAAEVPGTAHYRLLSVNEPEQLRRPCAHLLSKRQGRWELAPKGRELLDLLTY